MSAWGEITPPSLHLIAQGCFHAHFWLWHEPAAVDTFSVRCGQAGPRAAEECTCNSSLNGPIVLLRNIELQRLN